MYSQLTVKISCPIPEAQALFDEFCTELAPRLEAVGGGVISRRFEAEDHVIAEPPQEVAQAR